MVSVAEWKKAHHEFASATCERSEFAIHRMHGQRPCHNAKKARSLAFSATWRPIINSSARLSDTLLFRLATVVGLLVCAHWGGEPESLSEKFSATRCIQYCRHPCRNATAARPHEHHKISFTVSSTPPVTVSFSVLGFCGGHNVGGGHQSQDQLITNYRQKNLHCLFEMCS
jgi:hypothetical protein